MENIIFILTAVKRTEKSISFVLVNVNKLGGRFSLYACVQQRNS